MQFTVLTTKLCMVIQKYFSIINLVVYYKWETGEHQLPRHPVAMCELYKDIMETSQRHNRGYLVLSHYHIQIEIMAQIQCLHLHRHISATLQSPENIIGYFFITVAIVHTSSHMAKCFIQHIQGLCITSLKYGFVVYSVILTS